VTSAFPWASKGTPVGRTVVAPTLAGRLAAWPPGRPAVGPVGCPRPAAQAARASSTVG
jgi:hypothetical protein